MKIRLSRDEVPMCVTVLKVIDKFFVSHFNSVIKIIVSKIYGFHGYEYEDDFHLKCNAVYSCR